MVSDPSSVHDRVFLSVGVVVVAVVVVDAGSGVMSPLRECFLVVAVGGVVGGGGVVVICGLEDREEVSLLWISRNFLVFPSQQQQHVQMKKLMMTKVEGQSVS